VTVEVSVVIPSRDEEKTIGACIDKAQAVFEALGVRGEVVVADSSKDNTKDVAEEHGAKVVFPDKRGYGNAFRYAFNHISGKYVVLGDADDTYDFAEMGKLLEPLMKGEADMVVGTRLRGEIKDGAMPWLHRKVGNPLLTGSLNLFFGAGISDAHCGFRALTRDALGKLRLEASGMEFASEMIVEAAKKKLRIREVPITYYPRMAGDSKLGSFSDGWRHMKFMLIRAPSYLYFAPSLSLGVLGVGMMFLGRFGINVGYVPGVHTLVLGALFLMAGYQVFLLGLFSKVYGVRMQLFEPDRTTGFVMGHLTLERGAIIGAVVFLGGVALAITLAANWVSSGFVELPLNGDDIISFTLIIFGLQTFFSSFFLSMLNEEL
jgi:glycosyltransferase involved in cell wall biosynthesis